MMVRKGKIFVVPGVVGVLIARAQVAKFYFWVGVFKNSADQLIETIAFEHDGNRTGKGVLGLPTDI
jgi:hypothetical protein